MDGEVIEIVSRGKDARLKIEVSVIEFGYFPGLELSVTLSDEDFCEAHVNADVQLDDYKTFVAALQQSEKTRRGRAELHSLSTGELDIVVESSDQLGHFTLSYRLSKRGWDWDDNVIDKVVTGRFVLDSEFFAQMVSDFAYLLTTIKP